MIISGTPEQIRDFFGKRVVLDPHGYNKSYAILVGVNNYKHTDISNLVGPENEIGILRKLLIRKFHFPHNNIITLAGEEVTSNSIRESLNSLVFRGKCDDRVLIYFSGHGTKVSHQFVGDNYFYLPQDTDPSNINTYFSWDELLLLVRRLPAKHILIVIDTCFSGQYPFLEFSPSRIKQTLEVFTKKSIQIICSGQQDQLVYGSNSRGQSCFSHFFVKALKRDGNKNIISGDEIMVFLHREMKENNCRTLPRYGNIVGEGDFIFNVTKIYEPTIFGSCALSSSSCERNLKTGYLNFDVDGFYQSEQYVRDLKKRSAINQAVKPAQLWKGDWRSKFTLSDWDWSKDTRQNISLIGYLIEDLIRISYTFPCLGENNEKILKLMIAKFSPPSFFVEPWSSFYESILLYAFGLGSLEKKNAKSLEFLLAKSLERFEFSNSQQLENKKPMHFSVLYLAQYQNGYLLSELRSTLKRMSIPLVKKENQRSFLINSIEMFFLALCFRDTEQYSGDFFTFLSEMNIDHSKYENEVINFYGLFFSFPKGIFLDQPKLTKLTKLILSFQAESFPS